MRNKLSKLKLNRQIKKQEKQMIIILDKLEHLEPNRKEIIISE